MRPMSNDELAKHAIRTSADLLELTEKVDDIRRVQDHHTEQLDRHTVLLDEHTVRLDEHTVRLGEISSTLKSHIAVCQDHFRKTDANFLEIRDLLGKLLSRSS